MSEIKKELRLVATLDDSAFKRQIAELKKSLGKDLSFDPQSMNSLKDVFKDVAKDFSNEIKKAIDGIKSSQKKTAGEVRDTDPAAKQRSSRPNPKDSFFDADTGKYLKLGLGDVYDSVYKKIFKSEKDMDDFRKSQNTKYIKEMGATEKREKEKALKEEFRKREQLSKSPVTQLLTRMGVGQDKAMKIADVAEQGPLGGAIRAAGGLNKLSPGLGTVGIAAAGAGLLGAGIGQIADEATDMRRTLAQRRQAQQLETLSGKGLSGAIGQSGRGFNFTSAMRAGSNGLGYGAAGAGIGAGIGALFGGIGAIPGAAIGGGIGAAYGGVKGFFKGGEEESETRKKQTELATRALDTAKSLRDARIAAMTGGGVNGSQLSIMQQRGAEQFGYGGDETLKQFISARQYLGNKNAAGNMGTLQDLSRRTGMDVGEGARASEIFAGASGQGMNSGVQQTVEMLKKGVSAGVTDAKLPQFLKTTADFIQGQTGQARLNPDDIGNAISRSAFGFARGGDVTETNMNQAKNLQETIRGMSGTTEGLAGGVNLTDVMDQAKKSGLNLDTFQMLGLANSSNLGGDAMKQMLQGTGTDDQINDMVKGLTQKKNNVVGGASSLLFGDNASLAQQAFAAKTAGMSGYSEDIVGNLNAMNVQGPPLPGNLPNAVSGTEMANRVADMTAQQKAFVEGLGLMAKDTEAVSTNMKELVRQLRSAADAAKSFADQGISRNNN